MGNSARGTDGPPGSETRSCAQGNHGNLRSPGGCSSRSLEGSPAEGRPEAASYGRQDDGSGRSTVDGDEGNESTGGRAPTGEEPGRGTREPNAGSGLSSRSS